QYGVPVSWYFPFTKAYWKSDEDERQNSLELGPSKHSVRDSSSKTAVVRVNNLTKKFGHDKIAVNDVSFTLYENEITGLL
ncbi:unnamed protein product, partial [Didymodactylos carnosus]